MKELALNSGGFDSVVMIHDLQKTFNRDLVSLFFDYGQSNLEFEREKARKVADKLDIEHVELKLPSLDWGDSTLFGEQDLEWSWSKEYFPMRNLIFLSYAISYASSRGIKKVHSALVSSEQEYNDTTVSFIEEVNKIAQREDVEVNTPYITLKKPDLGSVAREFNIEPSDYVSCNNLDEEGDRCGICGVCKDVKRIEDNYLLHTKPEHNLIFDVYGDILYTDSVKKEFINQDISKVDIHSISLKDLEYVTPLLESAEELDVRSSVVTSYLPEIYQIREDYNYIIPAYLISLGDIEENDIITLTPSKRKIPNVVKNLKDFKIRLSITENNYNSIDYYIDELVFNGAKKVDISFRGELTRDKLKTIIFKLMNSFRVIQGDVTLNLRKRDLNQLKDTDFIREVITQWLNKREIFIGELRVNVNWFNLKDTLEVHQGHFKYGDIKFPNTLGAVDSYKEIVKDIRAEEVKKLRAY